MNKKEFAELLKMALISYENYEHNCKLLPGAIPDYYNLMVNNRYLNKNEVANPQLLKLVYLISSLIEDTPFKQNKEPSVSEAWQWAIKNGN